MTARSTHAFLGVLLAALCACGEDSRVVLLVDGDATVRAAIGTLSVLVMHGPRRTRLWEQRIAVAGPTALPLELPLDAPGAGQTLRIRLLARDRAGRPIARRGLVLTSPREGAIGVRIRLESSCADLLCDEERDLGCLHGACTSAAVRRADLVERPTTDTDLMALGERLERRREYDEAVRVYAAAIERYHYDFEAAYRIGEIECFRRKDLAACARWSRRMHELQPESPRARRLLAQEIVLSEEARRARPGIRSRP